jgi:16S rRNA (cytidine1402-2'-O)-methyltransferase
VESPYPAVVYESKHRIVKFLEELRQLNRDIFKHNRGIEEQKIKGVARGKDLPEKIMPITSVVICRELSKMHETVYRGDLDELIEKIKDSNNDQKGEFVVIVGR